MLTPTDIHIHRLADFLSGILIGCMVVFSPWAFGTTQPWSIWTMNVAGYVLGVLLLLKLFVRKIKGYPAPRWTFDSREARSDSEATPSRERARFFSPRNLTWALAVLTAALLLYTLISAANARAVWLSAEFRFDYLDYISWLPHSLDAGRTWFAFWQYLGLACAFWAIRDWLLGKARSEELVLRETPALENRYRSPIPERLRVLLWLLAINGALLAVEGIVQRIEGSGNLLFLVKPRVNPGAEAQFGPYAYRSNASQYFNLLWPVCLGFWWTLHRTRGTRDKRHHALLACAALMAACAIISTSRGGAIVTVAIAIFSAAFLLVAQLVLDHPRSQTSASRNIAAAGVLLFLVSALALGLGLGWKDLQPRMADLDEGYEQREAMYERARPMARDYPILGTGPNTFRTVFQLYRINTDTYWPAQLHNDWLETRITFGWLGSSLIALSFLVVLVRWFARGGIFCGRRFIVLIWMALAGCMVHARWDLPLQIHSIVFLFLLVCVILMTVSRRPSTE